MVHQPFPLWDSCHGSGSKRVTEPESGSLWTTLESPLEWDIAGRVAGGPQMVPED